MDLVQITEREKKKDRGKITNKSSPEKEKDGKASSSNKIKEDKEKTIAAGLGKKEKEKAKSDPSISLDQLEKITLLSTKKKEKEKKKKIKEPSERKRIEISCTEDSESDKDESSSHQSSGPKEKQNSVQKQQNAVVQVYDSGRWKHYLENPLRGGEKKEVVETYKQAFLNFSKDPSRINQEWQFLIKPWLVKKSQAEILVQLVVQKNGTSEEYFDALLKFSAQEQKSELYSTEILDWMNGLTENKSVLSHLANTQDCFTSILSKRLPSYGNEENRKQISKDVVEILAHETMMALLGKETLSNWKTQELGAVLENSAFDLAIKVGTNKVDKVKPEISLPLVKKSTAMREIIYTGKGNSTMKSGQVLLSGTKSTKRKLETPEDFPCTRCKNPEKAKSHRTSEHISRDEKKENYRRRKLEKESKTTLTQPKTFPTYAGMYMPQLQHASLASDPMRQHSFNYYENAQLQLPINQYGTNMQQAPKPFLPQYQSTQQHSKTGNTDQQKKKQENKANINISNDSNNQKK